MFYPRIEILLDQGRFEAGEAAIQEELRTDVDNPILHLLLCRALIALGKPRQAEEAAGRAIALAPDLSVAHFVMANILIERHRPKDALRSIDTALELDPYDADNFALKGRILYERSKNEAALKTIEEGLAIDPDNESCRFYHGILLGALGRHDEAAEVAGDLLADGPDEAENHRVQGWVCLGRRDGALAEQHFTEALRIEPENEDARNGMAMTIKLRYPVLGLGMRAILLLDRVPFHWILIGAVGFGMLVNWLRSLPPPAPFLGHTLDVLFWGLFCLIIILDPLFHLCLRSSRTARHSLTEGENRAIRWFLLPLFLGVAFLVLWALGSARDAPYLAMVWFAVTRLTYEFFQTPHPWVRRRMLGVTIAALLGALIICYSELFIVGRQALALQEEIRALSEAAGEGEKPDLKPLVGQFEELMDLRRWRVRFPAWAVAFLALCSDSIRGYLLRHAPDRSYGD